MPLSTSSVPKDLCKPRNSTTGNVPVRTGLASCMLTMLPGYRVFLNDNCLFLRLAILTALNKSKWRGDSKGKKHSCPALLVFAVNAGTSRPVAEGKSMFFWVSKVFWLLAQPLSLVFLMMLAGLIFMLRGQKRSAAVGLTLGLLIHGTVSFTNFGYVLMQPLEDRFAVPSPAPTSVDAIIMLGGATLARPSSARQITELNEAGDRLTTTLWLANAYPAAKVFISGGSGVLSDEGESEAETASRFFLAHDIAADRLVLEGESRNTDENVANTKALLGADGAGSLVLVTSAFHMPRSVGIFRQAGVDVIPWPTDYRTPGPQWFGLDIVNPMQNIVVSTVVIKEWIG
ncbi:MAG: YdcF family protein, partial [Alphaproteobacteria bacterium]